MATKTISQLSAAGSVTVADLLAIVQSGTTLKATVNQLITLLNTKIQISESQVTNLTLDLSSKLNKSGGTMTGALILFGDPTSSLEAATKQYVDNLLDNLHLACRAASTSALNTVYNNGSAGIGATLTNNGALVSFSVDGYSASIGDRILVTHQTNQFENGIYTVTVVGDGSTAWVLTRATDYDQSDEIDAGDIVPIISGTTWAYSQFMQYENVSTIGTDNINFVQSPLEYIKISDSTISSIGSNQNITIIPNGTGIFDVFSPPATESTGIMINGTTYNTSSRVNDIGGGAPAQFIIHKHSTSLAAILLGTRSNSNTDTHVNVTNGQSLFTILGAGTAGNDYKLFGQIDFSADTTGTISNTSAPGRLRFYVTPDASVTPALALTFNNDAVGDFSQGLTLPTSGGTASTLNYYEEYSHTTDWSGIWASAQTQAAVVKKINGLVIFSVQANVIATANTVAVISMDTVLPSRFRPSSDVFLPITVQIDGITNTVQPGYAQVKTTGDIDIATLETANNTFTGSNNEGFYAFTIQWTV